LRTLASNKQEIVILDRDKTAVVVVDMEQESSARQLLLTVQLKVISQGKFTREKATV
jgi:hypothetical protein